VIPSVPMRTRIRHPSINGQSLPIQVYTLQQAVEGQRERHSHATERVRVCQGRGERVVPWSEMRIPNNGQRPYDCQYDRHNHPTPPAATASVFTLASGIPQRLGTQSHECPGLMSVLAFGHPGDTGLALLLIHQTPTSSGRRSFVRVHARSVAASSHVICGKATDGTRDQSYTQEGCAARSRQGSVARVSKQRAHSVGSAAAAAVTRVLSSTISSTMCAASAKTAAVTMPARWCERKFACYMWEGSQRHLRKARQPQFRHRPTQRHTGPEFGHTMRHGSNLEAGWVHSEIQCHVHDERHTPESARGARLVLGGNTAVSQDLPMGANGTRAGRRVNCAHHSRTGAHSRYINMF
jgi:hypothetical protein